MADIKPGDEVRATGRSPYLWADLRVKLTVDAATEQRLGDDHSETSGDLAWDSANQHWGRANALREVLATMDRMETGQ